MCFSPRVFVDDLLAQRRCFATIKEIIRPVCRAGRSFCPRSALFSELHGKVGGGARTIIYLTLSIIRPLITTPGVSYRARARARGPLWRVFPLAVSLTHFFTAICAYNTRSLHASAPPRDISLFYELTLIFTVCRRHLFMIIAL